MFDLVDLTPNKPVDLWKSSAQLYCSKNKLSEASPLEEVGVESYISEWFITKLLDWRRD